MEASEAGYSETSVNWTLRKLTTGGKLFRLGHGVYSVRGNQPFRDVPDESLIARAKEIIGKYPAVKACFYNGTILSPLLHHLAYNALTYIEVSRELTDILFHQLQDAGERVWLKPSYEVMQNYIDFSQQGIIIKPLISGSQLTTECGIPTPTLEKHTGGRGVARRSLGCALFSYPLGAITLGIGYLYYIPVFDT
ncbi:MAG: hypothetical protein IJU13_06680 [Bacteroidales bacterium]|nr:hypothetical protein [Bacteroidales bacterium]